MADEQGRVRIPEHILLSLLLMFLTLLLAYSGFLWRWDQLVYDAQLKFHARSSPTDVVIVAIDEQSLKALGKWPWPRRVHARLLDRLTQSQARAVVMDVLFAEPDLRDPEGDRELARASMENGRVLLPVINEQARQGGQLLETMPLPELAATAAGFGHAEVDLDLDGVARDVYLLAGLGQPRWPYLGLAVLRFIEPGQWQNLPGRRNPAAGQGSPFTWVRDYHIRIPYAGPPGHFQRISYSEVLQGNYDPDVFRDAVVFVGATATGLGDILPTPVSGLSHPMPGVEITANIFDGLRNGLSITSMGRLPQLLLTGMLVILPIPLFAGRTPRVALIIVTLLLIGTVALTLLLLRHAQLWFPPTPVFLALTLSYPLWSWRRLEYAVRYFSDELTRLDLEPRVTAVPAPAPDEATGFVRQFLPIDAWILLDENDRPVSHWGIDVGDPPVMPASGKWLRKGLAYWLQSEAGGEIRRLGLLWRQPRPPNPAETEILQDLVAMIAPRRTARPQSTVELVERQVEQVREATENLGYFRRFISGSLAQMTDGLVVASNLGQVLLANEQARVYLGRGQNEELAGNPVLALLGSLDTQGAESWPQLVAAVLLHRNVVQIAARSRDERDLLVQMGPLHLDVVGLNGLVCNIADISELRASERKRSEMLSFISHDLRSPLVSILALTELAREGRRGADFSAQVERYARRTLDLAEDFVQLGRAESGADEIEFTELDLVAVALNAVETVWSQAQARRIRIVRDIHVAAAFLRGDTGLLERALVNLLTNAIKYSPEEAEIRLGLVCDAGLIVCEVADTGYGIAAADLTGLFDRYRRIRRVEHAHETGSGIGLTFVKAVVDRHNGEIAVTSEIGKGSCFTMRLPGLHCDPL